MLKLQTLADCRISKYKWSKEATETEGASDAQGEGKFLLDYLLISK